MFCFAGLCSIKWCYSRPAFFLEHTSEARTNSLSSILALPSLSMTLKSSMTSCGRGHSCPRRSIEVAPALAFLPFSLSLSPCLPGPGCPGPGLDPGLDPGLPGPASGPARQGLRGPLCEIRSSSAGRGPGTRPDRSRPFAAGQSNTNTNHAKANTNNY